MEATHPDTNASPKIFEMNKAHGFLGEGERDITNTPFDIDTMAPLLNANTVILPRPTSPLLASLLLMEESQRGKSPSLNAN